MLELYDHSMYVYHHTFNVGPSGRTQYCLIGVGDGVNLTAANPLDSGYVNTMECAVRGSNDLPLPHCIRSN